MQLTPNTIETLIWAVVSVIGIIALNVAYVRSSRWRAIEKQGWPKTHDKAADMIRALGENAPKYTYTKESKPNVD